MCQTDAPAHMGEFIHQWELEQRADHVRLGYDTNQVWGQARLGQFITPTAIKLLLYKLSSIAMRAGDGSCGVIGGCSN